MKNTLKEIHKYAKEAGNFLDSNSVKGCEVLSRCQKEGQRLCHLKRLKRGQHFGLWRQETAKWPTNWQEISRKTVGLIRSGGGHKIATIAHNNNCLQQQQPQQQ